MMNQWATVLTQWSITLGQANAVMGQRFPMMSTVHRDSKMGIKIGHLGLVM